MRDSGPARVVHGEPRLDRSVVLHFQGDWGAANLHRVCGWLAQEFGDRAGPHTRVAIWSGRGGADGVRAVGRGQVDIGLTTPAAFAAAALDGRGIYAGEAYPFLRAIGVVPQRDRLVVAVDRSLGVSSIAGLTTVAAKLRLAMSPHEGVNNVGWAAHELLTRSGLPPSAIAEAGGEVIERERPLELLAMVRSGRANAIVHEAIMSPAWQQAAADVPLVFLPPEPAVLDGLERDLGWPAATLPAGYLPGLAEPLRTLDFSDFLLVVREDLPTDVAYLLAWCLVQTRHVLEAQYRHIAPERSPVTYPLDPVALGRTPIQLHPGAAAYFAAAPDPASAP